MKKKGLGVTLVVTNRAQYASSCILSRYYRVMTVLIKNPQSVQSKTGTRLRRSASESQTGPLRSGLETETNVEYCSTSVCVFVWLSAQPRRDLRTDVLGCQSASYWSECILLCYHGGQLCTLPLAAH